MAGNLHKTPDKSCDVAKIMQFEQEIRNQIKKIEINPQMPKTFCLKYRSFCLNFDRKRQKANHLPNNFTVNRSNRLISYKL